MRTRMAENAPGNADMTGKRLHSVLRLFTGFATAALIAWYPTVSHAKISEMRMVSKNIPKPMSILYA